MVGLVASIEKAVGDRVEQGEAVIIIESMKMQIPVESPVSGTVSEIRVAPRQAIDEGQVLYVVTS
jgi:biotin carboxyl carrier protein